MFLAEIRRRCKNVDKEKADEFCVCMCFKSVTDVAFIVPKITTLIHITTFILCIIQILVLTTGT